MKKNIRILQLGKFFPPDLGGIESVMFDIVRGLNERQIACDVLCANSMAKYKEEIFDCNLRESSTIHAKSSKIHADLGANQNAIQTKSNTDSPKIMRCASFGKLASTAIAPQMIFKLRKIIANYDIIHIHLPDPTANLALFLANHKGKKVIIHWHSDIVRQKFLLKLYAPLQKWLLNRADFIIATTQQYADFSPTLKPFAHKIVAIPIGIDSLLDSANERNLCESSELRRDKKTIFALGRLVKYKGFEFLVESMRYLPDFKLFIAGSGVECANLQAQIKHLGLENRVFLLGKIDEREKIAHLNNDSIFVLPSISRAEAFGVVQLEAMSCKMPVIATNIKGSGVSFVNADNESGLNIPPCDSRAIAEAVNRIVSEYERFSEGAYRRYLAHFTRDKMIDKIANLYDRIRFE